MKIRVKRLFKYTWDNKTTHELVPGVYDVPGEVAENTALLSIQFGAAVWINQPLKRPAPKKQAPENKVVKATQTKQKKVSKKKKVSRKK